MIGKQGVSLLIGHNGVQDKTALNPLNETVARGIYDATTLSAVDADLQVGNIKLAENIFGFVGTLAPGGVETLEMVSDADVALDATYTPGVSGIFFLADMQFACEYFSTGNGDWYSPEAIARHAGFTAIGDGSNFRIKCGLANEYTLFRHHVTTWTYERARDEDLGAGITWTPADSGFFATGSEITGVQMEINQTTSGWVKAQESLNQIVVPVTIAIGDGTRLRVKNTTGGNRYHVTMRAALT